MSIKNYTTKVPVNRTVGHIQDILVEAGADGILMKYDDTKKPCGLTFRIKAPDGVQYYDLPVDVKGVSAALARDNDFRDQAHAERVAWRILKDWIDSQMAIIEAKMATLDQVLLPYRQAGAGKTVYECIQDNSYVLKLTRGEQ